MTCAFFVFVRFSYFVSSHTFYCRVYGMGLLIFVLMYWPHYRHDALFCYFQDLELLWLTKLIESAIWMWFLFTCYLISSVCLHYQAFLVWSLNEDDGLLLIYSLIGVHNFCFFSIKGDFPFVISTFFVFASYRIMFWLHLFECVMNS